MLEWLFSWEVTSVVAVALMGIAFTFIGLEDFKLAKLFFLFAAADAAGGIVMWGAKASMHEWQRNLIAFVVIGGIGVLCVKALRYVDTKQAAKAVPAPPEVQSPPPQPTAEQSAAIVKENVVKWLTKTAVPFKEVPVKFDGGEESPFGFEVTLPNGVPMLIYIRRDWPEVLHFRTRSLFSPEEAKIWNGLNKVQVDKLNDDVGFELNSQHIYATYAYPPTPPGAMRQQALIVINPTPIRDLTEFTFSKILVDMTNQSSMAFRIRDTALRKYAKP